MSDLNISQKTISGIFSETGKKFLIPDYQRPYSWTTEHCDTLWNDLKEFAFPYGNDDADTFNDDNDKYFLGTIVTFNNAYGQQEVIDGQQRLITLSLLLRAFYEAFTPEYSVQRNELSKCLWKIGKDYKPDFSSCKISYEVVDDETGCDSFKKIIAEGVIDKSDKSKYAENYRFLQKKIEEFKSDTPDNFSLFMKRILDNCILLPIETNSQNTAFRIFTTLNDRGLQLSDSDIFKAQFYKSKGKVEKGIFINRWTVLERLCNKNFHPRKGTKLDDLFRRYMYYAKAKKAVEEDERLNQNKNISDTFSNMRDFYAENNYKILLNDETLNDLEVLANFWDDVANRSEKLSPKILKKLYVLRYSPYSVWGNVVSLYFMRWRDIDEEDFCNFLDKVTAMILMNAVLDLGKQTIRRSFVKEFKDIYNGEPLEFDVQFKGQKDIVKRRLSEMNFSNAKPITRAMLAWWTFRDDAQELPPIDTVLEIEHIYAVKRLPPLSDEKILQCLGNKALLEKQINNSASKDSFTNKKIYYRGYEKGKQKVAGTFNLELRKLAETKNDFTEDDILERNEKIFDAFIDYLAQNNLLK